MPITLSESQGIQKIAALLYNFLPGNPHPYANKTISYAGVAQKLGLGAYWSGGSKLPAIKLLLEQTLDQRRERFCDLILEIVRQGITYRANKGEPVTREEIKALNVLIQQVKFKIPDLWDQSFIDSLPSANPQPAPKTAEATRAALERLKAELINLQSMDAKLRGVPFEKFLKELFEVFDLAPHSAFNLVGEQIDGSLLLDGETYLIEAKWHKEAIGNTELLAFQGKVEGKAKWARGLFISYSDFTRVGLEAFSRGRATSIITLTAQDIYFILDGRMSLVEALRGKVRHAGETGLISISVYELSLRRA
jgi:hypothetical protein